METEEKLKRRTNGAAGFLTKAVACLGVWILLVVPARGLEQWVRSGDEATSSLQVKSFLTADPSTTHPQGLFLAGTVGRGIWRTTDTAHWFPSGLDGATVNAFAVAPSGTVYAGTQHGLVRSLDGANWTTACQGIATIPNLRLDYASEYFSNFFAVTANSTGTLSVLAGPASKTPKIFDTYSGFFAQSGDGGTSWTQPQIGHRFIYPLFKFSGLWIDRRDNVYLGSYYEWDWGSIDVYSSHWKYLGGADAGYSLPIAFCENQATGSLFAALDPSSSLNLLGSRDQGKTWDIYASLGISYYVPGATTFYPTAWSILSRPQGDVFVAAPYLHQQPHPANEGILRSGDDGETWQEASQGLGPATPRVLGIYQGILYCGTDQGIFKSTWCVPVGVSRFKAD